MKHNTSSKEQHKKGPNRFNEKQINVKNKIQVRWNSARRSQSWIHGTKLYLTEQYRRSAVRTERVTSHGTIKQITNYKCQMKLCNKQRDHRVRQRSEHAL